MERYYLLTIEGHCDDRDAEIEEWVRQFPDLRGFDNIDECRHMDEVMCIVLLVE